MGLDERERERERERESVCVCGWKHVLVVVKEKSVKMTSRAKNIDECRTGSNITTYHHSSLSTC
jgi:hypothetical protein